jgi:membrane protein DedA with SNARE-associated domain
MRHLRAIIEAWLKHGVRSLYDVHARGYLILGLIAGTALAIQGNDDPWIVRSSVWGIILLVLSATILAALRRREP